MKISTLDCAISSVRQIVSAFGMGGTLLACVVLLSCGSVHGQFRTAAVSFSQAPGTPAGAQFQTFGVPVLNNAGNVAFEGLLRSNFGGVTSNTRSGIWSEGNGSLQLVARAGDLATGTTSGEVFDSFRAEGAAVPSVNLNDLGQTAFNAGLRNTTPETDYGIWSEAGGALSIVVHEGQQAVGVEDDVLYSQFGTLTWNNAGETAYWGQLRSGGPIGTIIDGTTGFWSQAGGNAELVARESNVAPGGTNGELYDLLGPDGERTVTINEAGGSAFIGHLKASDGTGLQNNNAVWAGTPDALQLVARELDAAPGAGGGQFLEFSSPIHSPIKLNNAGQVAFQASLVSGPGGVTGGNDSGIWAGGPSSLQLVVREGSQAPDTPTGADFNGLRDVVLNQEGRVAFVGSLRPDGTVVQTTNNSGIWSNASGTLSLVAREGSSAPGTSAGVNFDQFATFSAPSINKRGQIAFLGLLQQGSGGVTTDNDRGIWATDADGTLQLIVREGDFITLNSVAHTISRLDFLTGSGNEDGLPSAFNDYGQIAFRAIFATGGYGIFVANDVAVEPADFNSDGLVNADDLAAWQSAYNVTSFGDADGDGDTDGADFLRWQRAHDLGSSSPAVAVPEPGAFVMELLLLAGGLTSRRRRSFVLSAR